jgi:hypothetical protein
MTATTRSLAFACLFAAPLALFGQQGSACSGLPNHTALRSTLQTIVVQPGQPNGGLDNNMWATVVNRDGEVCAVAFSGNVRGDFIGTLSTGGNGEGISMGFHFYAENREHSSVVNGESRSGALSGPTLWASG